MSEIHVSHRELVLNEFFLLLPAPSPRGAQPQESQVMGRRRGKQPLLDAYRCSGVSIHEASVQGVQAE